MGVSGVAPGRFTFANMYFKGFKAFTTVFNSANKLRIHLQWMPAPQQSEQCYVKAALWAASRYAVAGGIAAAMCQHGGWR